MAESSGTTSLWVFGYGSLVWKPGFQHGQTSIGYIEGYSRKLWQGNETHRGTLGKPGRVATLIEEQDSRTYGVAMELRGDDALDYLNNREMTLGGYIQRIATFHPLDLPPNKMAAASVTTSSSNTTSDSEEAMSTSPTTSRGTSRSPSLSSSLEDLASLMMPPFPVLVFIATAESKHWLGPAPDYDIAKQVVGSSGPSGHNVEYVVRLAQWIRSKLPFVWDEHLFTVESFILEELKVAGIPLESLLPPLEDVAAVEGGDSNDQSAPTRRPASYSSTCQVKSLRCVKL